MRRRRWVLAGLVVLVTGLAPAAVPVAAVPVAAGGGSDLEMIHATLGTTPPTGTQCELDFGVDCYRPAQIRTAYDMAPLYAAGLDGRGETIAVVDSFGSPTNRADLASFDAAFGLPAPPSFGIIAPAGPIPRFDKANSQMLGWAGETTLDVEWAHAMAPGARILLVETPVSETVGLHGIPQMVTAENYVVNHHLAGVISQSWGTAEISFPSKGALLHERSAFVDAAAHHVTVLAAAGDAGPTSPSNAAATLYYDKRAANWPATDPLVTAVGGLRLHLSATGRRVSPDTVWNDNSTGQVAAGGGGLSTVFPRPAWQSGVAGVVGTHRGIPDVSLSAALSGAVLVYASFPATGTGFYPVGGTSVATPLFAAIVAIADQKAGHDLGSINPTLYALAARHSRGIVDVTSGNNTVRFYQDGRQVTVDGWAARRGYDLGSGLGTVNAAELVPELAAG
ncbi:MAG: S53 family peptidase [Acidimicrobiales bacterium]